MHLFIYSASYEIVLSILIFSTASLFDHLYINKTSAEVHMTNLRKKKGITGDRNNVQRRGKATASYVGGNTIVPYTVIVCVRARCCNLQFRRLENLNLVFS
jgi:hypothetical protein